MKAAVSIIICLSFCLGLIECSCLSYGHSCWGAHGKRSSNSRIDNIPQERRWPMLHLNPNENDDDIRYQPDDSLDYIEKLPNLLDVLRRRESPIVILHSDENTNEARSTEQLRTRPTYNARKRRSSLNKKPVANIPAVNKPLNELLTFESFV